MPTDSTIDASTGASRRSVILAGTALVAGAALFRGDLGAGNGGLAALASSSGPRVGVGYVEGSAGVTSLSALIGRGGARVLPAHTLQPGGLSNTAATVLVHGFSPGTAADAGCSYERVLVDAHIASPDRHSPDATIPFYAWTFRRSPVVSASGRSRFVISASRGLRVGFSVDSGRTATTVFTSGSERNLPKLQTGIYLLGLDEGAWSTPRSLPALADPAWTELASMVVSVDA